MPKLLVDWSRVPDGAFLVSSNADLARRLKTTTQNVRHQRLKRGLQNAHTRGGWRADHRL